MAFKKPFLRAPGNYDTDAASDEATLPPDQYGESLTIQAHAEDADINVLMRRYGVTGKMPENAQHLVPMYGDFTEVTDYRSAVEAVNRAHDAFMLFPAELRARFDNDPQRLMEFAADPKNVEEMRKFGLANPAPQPPPLSRDTEALIEAVKGAQQPPKPPATT